MATHPASRRYGLAAFFLTALVIGVGAKPAATAYARYRLTTDYPWLQPGVVTLRDTDTVELQNASFDRGWVKGQLGVVTLKVKARTASIEGGHADVDLGARPPSAGGGQKKSVEVRGLSVHVRKGDYRATLLDASYHDGRMTFGEAHVLAPQVITLGAGSYEGGVLYASTVQAKVTLPALPGMERQYAKLVGQTVRVDLDARSGWVGQLTGTLQDETVFLLVFGASGGWASSKGTFKAQKVGLRHPWLSLKLEEIQGVSGAVELGDTPRIELDAPLKAQIRLRPPALQAEGTCEEWVGAVGAVGPLKETGLKGDLKVGVQTEPKPRLALDATCKPVSCVGYQGLRKPFTYTAIHADGTPFERTTGPGTPDWVPIGAAGKLPRAVEQMEDPGFAYHRGFIGQAYENSLIENLRTGTFTRGGSTLTMQLVKNVYLGREKTLLRKAQELLLAMGLEGCATKSEIMELYLNVVEFGPNVYGVGPGARHWFRKSPAALDLTEAFWMASLLPRPRKATPPTEAALAGIEKFMARLAEQGKLPEFVPTSGPVDASGWDAAP